MLGELQTSKCLLVEPPAPDTCIGPMAHFLRYQQYPECFATMPLAFGAPLRKPTDYSL